MQITVYVEKRPFRNPIMFFLRILYIIIGITSMSSKMQVTRLQYNFEECET